MPAVAEKTFEEPLTCNKCGKAASDETKFRKERKVCRACDAAAQAAWRLANPEKRRAQKASWRKANAEKHNASARAWYRANAERGKATRAAWREANPEKNRAIISAWSKANPHRVKAARHRHKSLKRSAPGAFTGDEWLAIIEKQRGRCVNCREKAKLTVDHIVPLSAGGSNYACNIQWLCHSCNSA